MTDDAQLALPGLPPPRRPRWSDREVLDAAALVVWAKVVTWLGKEAEGLAPEAAACAKTAIRDGLLGRDSGYEMARALEHQGWQPDDELVEILHDAESDGDDAHDEAVAAWVKKYQVKPALAVGQKVRTSDDHEGEIVRVEEESAQYVVRIPELGHVKSGPGSHGRYAYYDEVTPLSEAP